MLQKHYTVILCEVEAPARAAFQPQLNSEHREARWWPLTGLPPPQQMHPVVVCLHSVWHPFFTTLTTDASHLAVRMRDGTIHAV